MVPFSLFFLHMTQSYTTDSKPLNPFWFLAPFVVLSTLWGIAFVLILVNDVVVIVHMYICTVWLMLLQQ